MNVLKPALSSLRMALREHLPAAAQQEPALQAALRQGAEHPGKLLRGALVAAAARRHGLSARSAAALGAAVEYFHTASLLLDDLPCMDDAAVRRGQPCVHRRHGEATAILAALALINRAYALAHGVLAQQPRSVRLRATRLLDRALGVDGLVGGQAWDLAFARTVRSPALVSRVALGKTGALFTLAVLLPAELARPTRRERADLRALCTYWGLLYQLDDDLRDVHAVTPETGKTSNRDRVLARPNLALALGSARALARRARLARQAATVLARLTARGSRWHYLHQLAAVLAPVPLRAVIPDHAAA